MHFAPDGQAIWIDRDRIRMSGNGGLTGLFGGSVLSHLRLMAGMETTCPFDYAQGKLFDCVWRKSANSAQVTIVGIVAGGETAGSSTARYPRSAQNDIVRNRAEFRA